jgi:hypothetical protein
MWDFGWHLRGTVPLNEIDQDAAVFDRVAAMLKKQNKRICQCGPDHLVFDNPLWRNLFGANWLAMVIYDHGRFWIEQTRDGARLHYDLRSLHAMLFCLGGALMFFMVGWGVGGLLGGVEFAAGAFAWLYGMNLLLAFGRVPHVIRKAIFVD